MEMQELLIQAFELCGAGADAELIQLADQYPEPVVWRIALASLQRAKPARSPLGYLRTALKSAAAGHERLIQHATAPAEAPDQTPPPLLERVWRERHARRLREAPPPFSNQREWERADMEAATAALTWLFAEHGDESRGDPRWSDEVRLTYRELAAWWDLAKQDIDFWSGS